MMFRSFALSFVFGAALAANAGAAARTEAAKDWTASLAEVNTGEDVRKTCSARTSAGDWTLKLAIGDGDVLPPDAYPQLSIAATGDLGEAASQRAIFDFGDRKIEAKIAGGGNEVMIDNAKETSLALLKALAAGDKLIVTLAGKPSPVLSLSGFTASYRKLGQWCGFPTNEVAK